MIAVDKNDPMPSLFRLAVECDVTHSKQMAATFLPGATTAHLRFAAQLTIHLSSLSLFPICGPQAIFTARFTQ
jgi:hypothetical protein